MTYEAEWYIIFHEKLCQLSDITERSGLLMEQSRNYSVIRTTFRGRLRSQRRLASIPEEEVPVSCYARQKGDLLLVSGRSHHGKICVGSLDSTNSAARGMGTSALVEQTSFSAILHCACREFQFSKRNTFTNVTSQQ